jgi:hypothetical protein
MPATIHDRVRSWIDEHLEQFFARLGVVDQRPVGETESLGVIQPADVIDDAATVQGPESQMADENRHDGSDRDRRVPRKRFDPADVELLPPGEGVSRDFEIGRAAPDRHHLLIEIVTDCFASDNPDRTIRQREFLRVAQEAVDCRR